MVQKILRFCTYRLMLVIAILMTMGCRNPYPITPTGPNKSHTDTTPSSQPTEENWERNWLRGIPCSPPCWEGITPGITSATEAVSILKQYPFVKEVTVPSIRSLPDYGVVEWNLTNGNKGGMATFHKKSQLQIINGIGIIPNKMLELDQVIQVFGQPSHISATLTRPPDDNTPIQYNIRFIYMSHGFYLSAGSENNKPILENSMQTNGPTFFVSTMEGYLQATSQSPQLIVPWQGFKDFYYYCRDIESGKACREK